MKVIFALSNPPTKEFVLTRHNVGRLFVTEHLLKKYKSSAQKQQLYSVYRLSSAPQISVCLTETFMNLSGKPVAAFMRKNPTLNPADLIIIHDDLEHKFGNVRIKQGGSAQGHNGISSIVAALGTDAFKRLQIGIGRPTSRDPDDVAKYVLGQFSKSERQTLPGIFENCEKVLKGGGYF